jgi:heme/copper-type cytochrome/quinol oxidase subunit 2
MTTLALTILAQNTQSAPSDGVGAGLIVGTIVAVIVAVVILWLLFTRMTKASKGGVEPPKGERTRGNPPLESIDRGP